MVEFWRNLVLWNETASRNIAVEKEMLREQFLALGEPMPAPMSDDEVRAHLVELRAANDRTEVEQMENGM
jgi:hypothetical protein